MGKISDELRERGNGYFEQRNGDCEWFHAIADRIDAELVELPKDADGVPWRIGDRTESGQTIQAMGLNKHGWYFLNTGNEIDPTKHRHYHEPTVEDVLFEFAQFWSDEELTDIEHLQPDAAQTLAEYAAKVILTNHGFGEPHIFTHSSPDSWERIADELDEQAGSLTKDGYTWQEDAIHDLAGRIRKLAKEQGDE